MSADKDDPIESINIDGLSVLDGGQAQLNSEFARRDGGWGLGLDADSESSQKPTVTGDHSGSMSSFLHWGNLNTLRVFPNEGSLFDLSDPDADDGRPKSTAPTKGKYQ